MGAIVSLALFFQALAGSAVTAADVVPANGGFLFTPCVGTGGAVSPLGPRPVVARRTLASPLPHRAVRRHRALAHRPHRHRPVHRVRKVVHRPVAAHRPRPLVHRRAVPHRPAAHRPLYRKATYASPLCIDRAPVINTLLNDLGVPEFLPIAAPLQEAALPPQELPVIPARYPTPPAILPPGVPQIPGVPVPCCGGANTPPPAPPVTAVPEPATWALLLVGFGLLGWAARRRRSRRHPA